jgi:hypothetical protein
MIFIFHCFLNQKVRNDYDLIIQLFEDTKGVIRRLKSREDSQYNGQKKRKRAKIQTIVHKTLHRKINSG